MDESLYLKAKDEFINTKTSITKVANKYKINRKKLSERFKNDGIYFGKGYSEKIINEAKKLLQENKSIIEICKILNIGCRNSFSNELERRGIIKIKRDTGRCKIKCDSEEAKNIVKDYKNGMKRSCLMNKYGITDRVIYKILTFYNVERDKSHIRIHTVDEYIFETINTEQKAYWLGFLYADGYVSKDLMTIELTLQEKDLEHIYKFKEFMNSSSDIKCKNINLNDKSFVAYRLTICSKKIANDLNKMGCTPNKSLTLKFPSLDILPKELINHFIRGYFDGDGTVCLSLQNKAYKTKQLLISILGTEDFLEHCASNISNSTFTRKRIVLYNKSNGKASYISWNGNITCMKVYNYLYNNATIYLERKQNKFIAVLDRDI